MTDGEETNVAVVHRLNDLVNSGDFDAMDELFAPDYRDHNTGWRIETVADLKAVIARAREQFDLKNVIEDVIAADDKVVVRVNNTGHHRAEAFGKPPTGKATSMQTIEIYRFSGGRIAERWVVSDVVSLMLQLGVSLPL